MEALLTIMAIILIIIIIPEIIIMFLCISTFLTIAIFAVFKTLFEKIIKIRWKRKLKEQNLK